MPDRLAQTYQLQGEIAQPPEEDVEVRRRLDVRHERRRPAAPLDRGALELCRKAGADTSVHDDLVLHVVLTLGLAPRGRIP